ncbi:MAG: recombination mediator RecR [Pseudobdellovibrionaceae bacterium]
MLFIGALEQLAHELGKLPGVGPKTAQRLAYHVLKTNNDYAQLLSESLLRVKAEVHTCPQCFNYTDADLCRYCEDSQRPNDVLCVVEEALHISRIESSGGFSGRYHVLQGAISPLEGVGSRDLKIQELVQRVDSGLAGETTQIKEIILALDADLEGDTTVLYIAKLLQGKGVRLTRIAHGVPIGGDLDYIDDRTMGRALENRVDL